MKRLALLILVLSLGTPLLAAEINKALEPFAPLVGTSWVATFPNGASDEQKFEWLYDGRFLRNTHEVKSPEGAVVYAGETIYAVDTDGTIGWWYWNTTGGYMTGTVTKTTSNRISLPTRKMPGQIRPE